MSVRLYFIAILPPKKISEKVIAIKQEFADRFESSRALRPPPHVTLQAPFKMDDKGQVTLEKMLDDFFKPFPVFKIEFNNFGSFANRRNPVIFIHPLPNEMLNNMHKQLMIFLRTQGFSEENTSLHFNPHMTVAYRDLTAANFKKAWAEFAERSFAANFMVEKIHLLRHDGKKWIPVVEFKLSELG